MSLNGGSDKPVFLIPGLGATSRMYAAESWQRIARVRPMDWPFGFHPADMEDLAREIVSREGVSDGDTVIGSSLGGMVGCEIARLVRLERLVLIGSAVNPREVRRFLREWHPWIDRLPLRLMQKAAGMVPWVTAGMFAASDPHFVRIMTKAIFKWKGLRADVPLLRVHGRRDRVIPPPPRPDVLLDGGHLLAMTHAEECVETILDRKWQSGVKPVLDD